MYRIRKYPSANKETRERASRVGDQRDTELCRVLANENEEALKAFCHLFLLE